MTGQTEPRYLSLRVRLPARLWSVARFAAVAATLGLAVLLALDPAIGLLVFWGLVVPAVPLTWALAPGLWRNVCPMAAANQIPRVLGLSFERKLPPWLERHGYGLAFVAFFVLTALRPVLFQEEGAALAVLLVCALAAPLLSGIVFRGKSGFCGSLCPLRPAQGLYSRAPAVKVAHSHCRPCVGCSSSCPDLKPTTALLEELADGDQLRSGYRLLFAGALPGFTYAFFTLPPVEQIGLLGMCTRLAGAMLVGSGLVFALHTLTGARLGHLTALFGATSLGIFYWFNVPTVADTIAELIGDSDAHPWAMWEGRAVVGALILAWLVRGLRHAGSFTLIKRPPAPAVPLLPVVQAAASAPAPAPTPARTVAAGAALPMAGAPVAVERRQRIEAGSPAVTIPDRRSPDRPMRPPAVTFWPEGRRVEVEAGTTVAVAARAAGIELPTGCNAGMCGCDPVYVLANPEALSAAGEDESSTLARIGLPSHARLACSTEVHGDVTLSVAADAAAPVDEPADEDVPQAPAATPSTPAPLVPAVPVLVAPGSGIERVVIVGNGIAGITAASHVRKLDPSCAIDIVTASAHPFYNRIAATKLIHERGGLRRQQLLPDSWYDAQRIEQWLNTSVTRIDRGRSRVLLGTGDTLGYDRLILATGARATTPPLPGIDLPGVFAIRGVEDAVAIRAWVQDRRCRRAVVVGGGLLGLEAADALDQLEIDCTVVEGGRWLGNAELDERAGTLLRRRLDARGIGVVTGEPVRGIHGTERAESVALADGTALDADIVVVCVGITPNASLAREAGLEVAAGVVVDSGMRTADPAIFACGDAAQVDGVLAGRWPAAVAQGEVAAVNALGGARAFDARPIPTKLKVSEIDVTAIGRLSPVRSDEVIGHEGAGSYRKLVVSEAGALAGAVAFGPAAGLDAVVAAVRESRDVTGALDRLRAGDWTALDRRARDASGARRAA